MQLSKVKQIDTANNGFSLISVMVAIVILGILAVMGKPAVDSIYARARMAEAKNNLEFIKRSQEQQYLTHKSYEQFPTSGTAAIGYIGGGSHNCPNPSPRTFVPGACESLRYNYRARVRPGIFEVEAVAPSDKEKYYIYAGCDGAGTSIYNKNKGDVWIIRNHSNPIHCRDILDFCPSAAGKVKQGCKSLIAFNTAPALPLPTCATACSNWSSWNYTSWSPSTSSYCSGTSFTQTRTKYRTRTCPSGSICSKNESSQQSQTATGTSLSCSCCGNYGSWSYSGSWSPSTSSYCSGTSFTQTRGMTRSRTCPVGSTCTTTQSSSTSRTATGTGTSCSCCGNYGSWTYYGSWSPSTSSYCSGTNFTQTRSTRRTRSCPSGSNCTQTQYSSTNRNATGTKSCTTPIPPPTPTPTPNCSNCNSNSTCTSWTYSNCGTCGQYHAGYEYCDMDRSCGSCSSSCPESKKGWRSCSLTPTPTPTPNCSNCNSSSTCTAWNYSNCGTCSWVWWKYGDYEHCDMDRNCGSCSSCPESDTGYRSCSTCNSSSQCCDGSSVRTSCPTGQILKAYPTCCRACTEQDACTTAGGAWSNNTCTKPGQTWHYTSGCTGSFTNPPNPTCSSSSQCCDGNSVRTTCPTGQILKAYPTCCRACTEQDACSTAGGTWNGSTCTKTGKTWNYSSGCTGTFTDSPNQTCNSSSQCCDGNSVRTTCSTGKILKAYPTCCTTCTEEDACDTAGGTWSGSTCTKTGKIWNYSSGCTGSFTDPPNQTCNSSSQCCDGNSVRTTCSTGETLEAYPTCCRACTEEDACDTAGGTWSNSTCTKLNYNTWIYSSGCTGRFTNTCDSNAGISLTDGDTDLCNGYSSPSTIYLNCTTNTCPNDTRHRKHPPYDLCYDGKHTCGYRYTVTKSGSTDYYYSLPNSYGSFGQAFHDSSISFTCSDSCGSVSGSTSVTVGSVDESDGYDGCSQGTNDNRTSVSPSNYNTKISWTCSGSGGGTSDSCTNCDPYGCTAGSFCDGSVVTSVDNNCNASAGTDCSTSGKTCVAKRGSASCVDLCADSPCSSSCRSTTNWGDNSECANHTHTTLGVGHTHSGNQTNNVNHLHGNYTCHDSTTGWERKDCTPEPVDPCANAPCSPNCRTEVSRGSCHDGHTHQNGSSHTDWKIHIKHRCADDSIQWTGESCTPDSECKKDPCQSGCSGTYWYNHCSNGQTSHTHSSLGEGHTHSGKGTKSVHHGHGTYCKDGTQKYERQDC